MDIDASELHKLAADLGSISRAAASRVRTATVKAALDIERDAKNYAPVDTGNLRASIGHSDLRMAYNEIEVEIGPTASYATFVEHGTSRMAPQAYMAPALDRNAPSWVAALEQIVQADL